MITDPYSSHTHPSVQWTGGLGPRGVGHQPSAVSGATGVRKNFLFGMATQMGGGLI